MATTGNEFSGKSVDEAVATGLKSLGVRSDQVQVEVLNKGSRGLFGIGSEPAVVRISLLQPTPAPVAPVEVSEPKATSAVAILPLDPPTVTPAASATAPEQSVATSTIAAAAEEKPKSEEAATAVEVVDEAKTERAAVEILSNLLKRMGLPSTVEALWKDSDDEHDERVLWLEVRGRNLGGLIGRRGETLENLQYLLRMMVNQQLHCWNDIVVDIDDYRTRRAEQLTQLAQRMAAQVISTGRAMALEPMPPNERRVIHMALRDHQHVYTQSSGDGDRRKVFIVIKS